MSLFIEEVTNQQLWDSFIISQPAHTFLHSWEWGEFNKNLGDNIWRLGVYDNEDLQAVMLIILVHAKRGNFLFTPHGPILHQGHERQAVFISLIKKLKQIAQQEHVNFIRISPLLEDTPKNRELFEKFGFRPAPIHMHAEVTWTLNILPAPDTLLQNMRKTTRQLIRRAEREGVTTTFSTKKEDLEHFYNLYRDTVVKHSFVPFSYEYIQRQIEGFAKNNQIAVVLAWYQGKPQAGAIVVYYGNSAFYHHGASSLKYPKIPSSYAVQWAAIQEAKNRGKTFYNFWGIAPNGGQKHPWAGITLFKKGFGGFRADYVHAQDIPLSWKYWPNYLLETYRRWHRHL